MKTSCHMYEPVVKTRSVFKVLFWLHVSKSANSNRDHPLCSDTVTCWSFEWSFECIHICLSHIFVWIQFFLSSWVSLSGSLLFSCFVCLFLRWWELILEIRCKGLDTSASGGFKILRLRKRVKKCCRVSFGWEWIESSKMVTKGKETAVSLPFVTML